MAEFDPSQFEVLDEGTEEEEPEIVGEGFEEVPQQPTSPQEAAIQWYMDGMVLGYLPQLQAMGEPVLDRISQTFGGQSYGVPGKRQEAPAPWAQSRPGSPEYMAARKRGERRLNQLMEAHPLASRAGEVAGIATGLPIQGRIFGAAAKGLEKGLRGTGQIARRAIPGRPPPVQQGPVIGGEFAAGQTAKQPADLLERVDDIARRALEKRVAESGRIGGLEAASMDPGTEEGVFDPIQLERRALYGALGRTGGRVGAKLGAKVPGAFGRARRWAIDQSDNWALKAAGGMLKEFRLVAKRGNIRQLGDFMRDRILKSGEDVARVARRSGVIKKLQGRKIGRLYQKAYEKIRDQKAVGKLSKTQKMELLNSGFDPVTQKQEILSLIKEKVKLIPGEQDSVIKFMDSYLDALQRPEFGNFTDIRDVHTLKRILQDQINWGKVAGELPGKQKAFDVMQKYVSRKIDDHFSKIDKLFGSKTAKELKEANRIFGLSAQIEEMARDKAAREAGNRFLSLGDRLAADTYANIGIATGDPKGALVAIPASFLSRLARTRGSAFAAPKFASLEKGISRAEKGIKTISKYVPDKIKIAPKSVPTGLARTGVRYSTSEFEPENQTDATGGPQKWMSTGFKKLYNLASEDDMDILDKYREDLMDSSWGRNLLIGASEKEVGSKKLKEIIGKIKKRYGEE